MSPGRASDPWNEIGRARAVRPPQTDEFLRIRDFPGGSANDRGDIGLLRALLAERDRRLADKEREIVALRRRLALLAAERRLAARHPASRESETAVARDRLATVKRSIGRLLDFCADIMLAPPSPNEQRPAIAERAAAEQALLRRIPRRYDLVARADERF